MSDFFSKYKGRGGPAIEPGIIQMMGSIGDEYAKGIDSLGDSISGAILEKQRRDKAENALQFMLDLASGKGTTPDEKSFMSAKAKRKSEVEKAAQDVADTKSAYNEVLADNGEIGDLGESDKLNAKIADITKQLAAAKSKADQKTKAVRGHEKLLKRTEVQASGQDRDFEGKYGNLVTPNEVNRDLEKLRSQEDALRNKEIPKLEDELLTAQKFYQMELNSPGSSLGRNAPKTSTEYQNAIERLNLFDKLKEGNDLANYEKRRNLGVLAAQVDPDSLKTPMPSLAESIPMMFQGDPQKIASLLNYQRPPTPNERVETAKNRVVIAEERLRALSGRPPLNESDYVRKLTLSERLSTLFEGKTAKEFPEGFGEKVLSIIQKQEGPNIRVEDMGELGKWLVTNQGATRLDPLPTATEKRYARDREDRLELQAFENAEDLNKFISAKRKEIEDIKNKAFSMDSPEGITEVDKEAIDRLEKEIEEAKAMFKSKQKNISEKLGKPSNPFVVGEIDEMRI